MKLDMALSKGSWLLLANCHLMISWLADLEKLIEEKPHPDFRMWISSSPSPQFPIGILQRSKPFTCLSVVSLLSSHQMSIRYLLSLYYYNTSLLSLIFVGQKASMI